MLKLLDHVNLKTSDTYYHESCIKWLGPKWAVFSIFYFLVLLGTNVTLAEIYRDEFVNFTLKKSSMYTF